MDDVFGQVVFTESDPDFGPSEQVMVALRDGLRCKQAQVGTSLRLGETHGSAPFAADQLGYELVDLLWAAVMGQRQSGRLPVQAPWRSSYWLLLPSRIAQHRWCLAPDHRRTFRHDTGR